MWRGVDKNVIESINFGQFHIFAYRAYFFNKKTFLAKCITLKAKIH